MGIEPFSKRQVQVLKNVAGELLAGNEFGDESWGAINFAFQFGKFALTDFSDAVVKALFGASALLEGDFA